LRFYASQGRWIASQKIAGDYFNKLQGTLFYEPDLSRPAICSLKKCYVGAKKRHEVDRARHVATTR